MDKVVLITGCRSGFGKEIAFEAARKGYIVYAGLRDLSTAGDLKSGGENLRIFPLQLDITKPQDRVNAVERIMQEQGRLDILVNNAGVALGGFLEQLEEDELRNVYDVNVFGNWSMMKAVLPSMRKASRGLVINISSTSAIIPFPGFGAYGSSKFALEGMSEVWRHELHRFGVKVVLIEPGAYKTDIFTRNKKMSRGTLNEESPYYEIMKGTEEAFLAATSRIAREPEEIARFVIKIFETENPAMRYPIGPSSKARWFIRRFLPFGVIQFLFTRMYHSRRKR